MGFYVDGLWNLRLVVCVYEAAMLLKLQQPASPGPTNSSCGIN